MGMGGAGAGATSTSPKFDLYLPKLHEDQNICQDDF